MYSRRPSFFSVALTTFIPWCLSLAVLETVLLFSRTVPLLIHYVFVILFYGVTFFLYHKKHKGDDPFTVMIFAIPSLLLFELIYFGFFYTGSFWFFTYFHWFVPLFLISSTIYGVGTLFQSR
jgi:hypothetical protein